MTSCALRALQGPLPGGWCPFWPCWGHQNTSYLLLAWCQGHRGADVCFAAQFAPSLSDRSFFLFIFFFVFFVSTICHSGSYVSWPGSVEIVSISESIGSKQFGFTLLLIFLFFWSSGWRSPSVSGCTVSLATLGFGTPVPDCIILSRLK